MNDSMIPKKIHYCWFGRGPKPELAERCIASWKKYCPNYEIIEWDEDNFNIHCNLYVEQAYEHHKYAFVTDYVRLYVLYNYGGIYMDTDVEVLKPLDEYLFHEALSGFENDSQIPTGLMACREEFPLFKELLAYYDTTSFVNSDGTLNTTTNVVIITNMMLQRGFIPNGQYQVVDGFALYPKNVFCPDHKKLSNQNYMRKTATIHFFAGSWKSERERKREGTWWWRYLIVPVSKLSHGLEKIGGKPFQWLKKVLWESCLKDKGGINS